jgi:CRP/FNR family transcriptional regulator
MLEPSDGPTEQQLPEIPLETTSPPNRYLERTTRCNAAPDPVRATLAELLQMRDSDAFDHTEAARIPVPLRRLRAGESLVYEGAPADAIFFVRSGTFKVFRIAEDGYEQVLAFAVRSEVLGFDALCMASYPAAMQALEDSTVYVIARHDIARLSQAIPAFAGVLQQAGSQTLTHSRELVDVLAAVASDVRLARFLIQLSQRMVACSQSPRRFLLRLGRRELASLLGVAHETVSRCFTALAALGLLQVDDREVEILDMNGLIAFSRNTRRPLDGAATPRNRTLARRLPRQHTAAHAVLN